MRPIFVGCVVDIVYKEKKKSYVVKFVLCFGCVLPTPITLYHCALKKRSLG